MQLYTFIFPIGFDNPGRFSFQFVKGFKFGNQKNHGSSGNTTIARQRNQAEKLCVSNFTSNIEAICSLVRYLNEMRDDRVQ